MQVEADESDDTLRDAVSAFCIYVSGAVQSSRQVECETHSSWFNRNTLYSNTHFIPSCFEPTNPVLVEHAMDGDEITEYGAVKRIPLAQQVRAVHSVETAFVEYFEQVVLDAEL